MTTSPPRTCCRECVERARDYTHAVAREPHAADLLDLHSGCRTGVRAVLRAASRLAVHARAPRGARLSLLRARFAVDGVR